VYVRRQFCADLEVCRPPEPLWNPRLREAATTLPAIARRVPQFEKYLPERQLFYPIVGKFYSRLLIGFEKILLLQKNYSNGKLL